MTTEQSAAAESMPFWKACLIAFGVLALLIVWVILGGVLFKLQNPWVGLLALTTFGSVFQSNMSDAPKVWIGSAVALLIAFLLWYIPEQVGPAGRIVGGVLIILIVGGLIAQKLPLICNYATLLMLTIATAATQIMNTHLHLTFLLDLAYGAVCFWLIPAALVKLRDMKKPAQ